jgi:hypothetical protein
MLTVNGERRFHPERSEKPDFRAEGLIFARAWAS